MIQNYAKIPQLLYRYLATEMLAPFFASFAIMNCVFFLVKLIDFLNFALDLQIGLADFVRLFSYLFPNIFLYSIPMAAMMGVTIGFARLSSDSEILALKASGISMFQIMPPVIIVSAIIAMIAAYCSIVLIPRSEIAMKQLTYQLLKEKMSKGVKEHMFTEALGEVVVYVDKIDKNSGEWQNVWVSDMRGVDNPVITMATSGHMESRLDKMMVSIILRNGSLHRPSRENAQIVQFDQYQINIPLNPPKTGATSLKKRTSLSMHQLLEEAAKLEEGSKERLKYYIEFHRRLVLPFGCLMISLLGLPLGLQARPGRKAIGIQAGLAIFILYYILFTYGKALAEDDVLPVAVSMWAPNCFFSLLAFFWIYRVANELSLIPDSVTRLWQWLKSALSRQFRSAKRACYHIGGKTVDEDVSQDSFDKESLGRRKRIRGNARSRVFHVPLCEYYDCRNCTIEFKNVRVALDAGFEPCRFCKDLISEND